MIAGVDGIRQGVRVAEAAIGLLDPPLPDQLADTRGAHDLPVERHGRDHIPAQAVLPAVFAEAFGVSLSPIAEAEIMPHHNMADLQIGHKLVEKFAPGHVHDAAVEVDEHHVLDTEHAADDLLAADGAVDERYLSVEDKSIRVHVKAQHGREGIFLRGALLCAPQ